LSVFGASPSHGYQTVFALNWRSADQRHSLFNKSPIVQ
jgi:hypothetical protein